jgi:hypothetical protein
LTAAGTLKPDCRRDIEDDRQIRPAFADRNPLQRPQQLVVSSTAGPLVHPGRVGEAIAKDPFLSLQSWTDDLLNMIGASGGEENRLAVRPHRFGISGQDKMANGFGSRSASGLAGLSDFTSGRRQCSSKSPNLRAFSGSVAAFECYELAGHRPYQGGGASPVKGYLQ